MTQAITYLRQFKTNFDPGLLVIISLPLLILPFNNNWIFNPPFSIDPWIYTGYFLRLEQYLDVFSGAYYGTRLPWIIPGHIAYSLLPPLIANYLLHLLFYYIATISIYLILKYTICSRSGLFTAILMGTHIHFLIAIGWDYVDGPGLAYFLVMSLMLTCAALFRRWWLFISFGGLFFGALIYTNTLWVAFTPPIMLYYWLLNRQNRRNPVITSLALGCLGFILGTLALCLFHYSLTQQFWFFLPSFQVAMALGSNPNAWKVPVETWLYRAIWLLLPAAATLFSIGSLFTKIPVKSRSFQLGELHPHAFIFQIFYLINVLIMVAVEIKGSPVLQFSYYSSYLIPSAFLAIGSLLGPLMNRFQKYQFYLILFGFIAAGVLLFSSPLIAYFSERFQWYVVIFCFLCLFATWLASFLSSRYQKMLMLGLALIAFGVGIFSLVTARDVWARNLAAQPSSSLQQQVKKNKQDVIPPYADIFLATTQTQLLLKAIDPDVELFFWFDNGESPVYTSISSASLWSYRLVSDRFPNLHAPADDPNKPLDVATAKARVKSIAKIAILSAQTDALQKAQQALSEVGFNGKVLSKHRITQADIDFTMTILAITEASSAIK